MSWPHLSNGVIMKKDRKLFKARKFLAYRKRKVAQLRQKDKKVVPFDVNEVDEHGSDFAIRLKT